jgi:hypothetical protein
MELYYFVMHVFFCVDLLELLVVFPKPLKFIIYVPCSKDDLKLNLKRIDMVHTTLQEVKIAR